MASGEAKPQCVVGSVQSSVDLGIAAIRINTTPDIVIQAGIDMLPKCSSYGYPPVLGLKEAREAVAAELSRAEQRPLEADRVALVLGARAATNAVIEFVLNRWPGTAILGPQLAWPEYYEQARRFGGRYLRARGSEADFYAPQADDFRRAWPEEHPDDVHLLVITNPGNPVGNRYSAAQLRDIVALARERDAYLMIDEAYKDFVYHPDGHQSCFPALAGDPELAAWADSRVAIVHTLAKSFQCPGARGGTLFAPPEIIRHLAATMTERSQALPLVTQAMVQAAAQWQGEARLHYLAQLRQVAQENVTLVHQWASRASPYIKPYTAAVPPASPLVFLNVAPLLALLNIDCSQLVLRLASYGLVTVPGQNSGDPQGLRLAIGHPTPVIRQALDIFDQFLAKEVPAPSSSS